jgi:hypothetical protein
MNLDSLCIQAFEAAFNGIYHCVERETRTVLGGVVAQTRNVNEAARDGSPLNFQLVARAVEDVITQKRSGMVGNRHRDFKITQCLLHPFRRQFSKIFITFANLIPIFHLLSPVYQVAIILNFAALPT